MVKKYFLLLKTHNSTKLKYLCFHYGTLQSCYTYRGSGSYWTAHLSKHGKDITTEIILESDNKDDISYKGIQLSYEWNIVQSKEYANLTIEDAQTTAEPLQRPEVRRKRLQSFRDRIKNHGLTASEKLAKQKNIKLMHTAEAREKAANTLRTRIKSGNLTDKERKRGTNKGKRIREKGFTEAELKSHEEISIRQKGKTMTERLNNLDYIDPRKGKSATEIFGSEYTGPWNKGKSVKELKGKDYVDPRSKPFTITSHLGTHKYNNEREFLVETKLPQPTLSKLKREGKYVVKRQSNSKHPFLNGELITYKLYEI